MPRKSVDQWLPDDRGRYRRRVGWWEDEKGNRKQFPFHFGTNKDQAAARLLRVKELWAWIEERCKTPPEDLTGATYDPEEPFWDHETLWLARELAAGKAQIVVERGGRDGYLYAEAIQRLARKYPFLHFVPEDEEAFSNGADFIERAARHELEKVRQLAPNVLPEVTNTLHEALDAYASYVKKTDLEPTPEGPSLTPFGALKAEQATRLKQRHADRPLSSLDLDTCQELVDYWRMRPLTSDKRIKPARPMAKKTCENQISELMRFFRWLHKTKDFGWRKPEDFDDLKTTVKDIQEERTSIAHSQVRTYLPEQLATLNKYATPLERLLLLLGLNCGLKGAEQGTLLLDHIFLNQEHPNARYLREIAKFDCRPEDRFILYRRNKSKVYGEFLLWPQTVEILRWAVERQRSICSKLGLPFRNLLVTKKGTLFYRLTSGKKNQSQIFGNRWDALIKRVRKDHADFPDYSFTSLRDTAGDLVRHVAGGEVSAVFLMHGQPVVEDNLLDLYTNRPFGKVFEALRTLQERLKPMFDAVPQQVCEQPVQQYTTLGKREQIVSLKKQGKKVSEIMAETGVSRMTVLRTLNRYWFKTSKRSQK